MSRRAIALILCLMTAASCGKRQGIGRDAAPYKVITHRVEEGETWESLARQYYGDPDRSGELAVFNGRDRGSEPVKGSGIRIPLGRADMRKLDRKAAAAKEYNAGLDMATKGSYSAAAERFEKALDIEPGFSDAGFNLAVAYQKLGMHARAVEILEDIAGKEADNAEYLYALGASYFHLGELSKAENTLEKVRSMSPGHLKALYSLAVVYGKMGKRDDAVAAWKEYLKIAPDDPWAESARQRLNELLGQNN